MNRKLILMYVNSCFIKTLIFCLLLLVPTAGFAVPGAVHDVHRLPKSDEFHSTIEARCTICHTRDRVDQAIGEQADLDELLQRMIEKGAILSERDYNVLGTFWGSPLKDAEEKVPEQQ